ncbi:unnamed protein product [Urochloa humidicola]
MCPPGPARSAAATAADPASRAATMDGVASHTRGRRVWCALPVAMDPSAGATSSGPRGVDARIPANPKKGTRNTGVSDTSKDDSEHFKTRFSTKRIVELIPELEEHQKDWIRESCFRSLLTMQRFSVPVKLVKWLMQQVNPLLSEFRYKDKVIVFTRDLVCKILGLETSNVPVKLSGDYDDVKDLRNVYKVGKRAKISKCIAVLEKCTDRDSFMRAFTLLALGTVYCPGTSNTVDMNYLHSLVDMSELGSYDWASHIIGNLMGEVKRYQNFTPEKLKSDHQMGSCLIILAIAYMDHLDLPTDRGSHQLNYSLPRICHVSNADFDFVMAADRNRLSLDHPFGKLPFRSIARTPYAAIPDVEVPIPPIVEEPIPPAGLEAEVDVVSSLDHWLHQQGSSSDHLQQIPVEYQKVAAHFSNLFKEDVISYASVVSTTITEHITGLWMKRNVEMLSKMAELAAESRSDGGDAGASTSGGAAADRPSGIDGGIAGSCTSEGAADGPPTTAAGAPRPPTAAASAPGPSTSPGAASNPPSSAAGGPEPSTSPAGGSGAALAATTKGVGAGTSTSEEKVSGNSNYYDDVPSFDLFKNGELDDEDHYDTGAGPLKVPICNITTPATATNPVPDAAGFGSSTREKKNRKKRAAFNLKSKAENVSKRTKLDDDAREAYNKYLNKRIMKKPIPAADGKMKEQPPFVQIAGFYVSYEDFYKLLKPRGEIVNHVMALWTYQLNLDELEARDRDKTIIKKYAFQPY